MEISERLSAYIEHNFEHFLRYEKKESENKEKYHKKQSANISRVNRSEPSQKLKALRDAQRFGYIKEEDYQAEERDLKEKLVRAKKQVYKDHEERLQGRKGKSHGDFNVLVCSWWYLIKTETKKKDAEIFKEIAKILTDKGYMKRSPKKYAEYTDKDIQRIVYNFTEGDYLEYMTYFKSYFDHIYSTFKYPC
ncbi:MAG: hypothetical protein ABIN18_17155 [Pseudomonadota bacterium]